MITRATTVGTLKNYRYNLNCSTNTMNKTMEKVTTHRLFNSYAEDPALATRCFQIRRSFLRTTSQLQVNQSVEHKFQEAWSGLDSVSKDLNTVSKDTAFTSILTGLNDPDASGRNALGQSMAAKAKSIVQTMNRRYGENYVFAGADTLNAPFSWGPKLNPEYLDLDGGTPDPTNPDHAAAFKYMMDPATTATTGERYTNDPADANQIPQVNPDYNATYAETLDIKIENVQKKIGALDPDDPEYEDAKAELDAELKSLQDLTVNDTRYGKYLKTDGTRTDDDTDPDIKKVAQENPDYNEYWDCKYLTTDKDGNTVGTKLESEASKNGLYYRGVAVDSKDPNDIKKLDYFTKNEHKYMDLGLGHKEEENGEANPATVFDAALQGVYFLGGYGIEENVEITLNKGDIGEYTTTVDIPNNVVSQLNRMSEILLNCKPDNGDWASKEEEAEFMALAQKFEDTASLIKQRWDEKDTESSFLSDNGELLNDSIFTMNEEITELEAVNPAYAISEFMFAKYTYDTALKVGNSVLSQSLMDYLNL